MPVQLVLVSSYTPFSSSPLLQPWCWILPISFIPVPSSLHFRNEAAPLKTSRSSSIVVWLRSYTPFTRYNRLLNRFNNRFDNRVERTATVRSTGCQTGLYNLFVNRLYTRYNQLSNQTGLTTDNRFDNRLYRVNGALLSTFLWH